MEVTLDLSGITTREAFHVAFAQALSFPEWYGNNLDALHDCLTAIGTETTLRLVGWDALEQNLGPYAKGAKKAILHAAQENPRLFVVFSY